MQKYLEQYTKGQAHHEIVLDAEAKNAFNTIKEVIECCPKLFFLTDTDPIIVYTDASTYDMGGYVTQLVTQYDGKLFLKKTHTVYESIVYYITVEMGYTPKGSIYISLSIVLEVDRSP